MTSDLNSFTISDSRRQVVSVFRTPWQTFGTWFGVILHDLHTFLLDVGNHCPFSLSLPSSRFVSVREREWLMFNKKSSGSRARHKYCIQMWIAFKAHSCLHYLAMFKCSLHSGRRWLSLQRSSATRLCSMPSCVSVKLRKHTEPKSFTVCWCANSNASLFIKKYIKKPPFSAPPILIGSTHLSLTIRGGNERGR